MGRRARKWPGLSATHCRTSTSRNLLHLDIVQGARSCWSTAAMLCLTAFHPQVAGLCRQEPAKTRGASFALETRVQGSHIPDTLSLSDGSHDRHPYGDLGRRAEGFRLVRESGIKTDMEDASMSEPDLSVPGVEGVYALGDFANIHGKHGHPLPQLASVAEQSGKWCARNILADLGGKPRTPSPISTRASWR